MVDKEVRRKQLNDARRKRYWLKKKRGQCTKDGCYVRVTDGKVRCDRHYKSNYVFSANWRRKPKNRNKLNRNRREQREARVKIGVCVRCGSTDLASEKHCQKCLDYFNARYKGPRAAVCGICREKGHDRRRCPKRFSHDVDREEYALSRTNGMLPI